MTAVFGAEDLTADGFLDGRLTLLQPRKGYRAAIDPVLLAAFTPALSGASVLDLGCGAGAAALCLAARVPGLDLHGLEIQPAYADLARRNAAANGQAMTVHDGDLRHPPQALRDRVFDLVLSNPPFHPAPAAMGARDAGRDAAHREGEADLGTWIAAGLRRLRPGGTFALVHLASRLGDALKALEGPTGGIEILPVAPRSGSPSSRILVRARKGVRAALVLHPPLVLHRPDGSFAPEADQILRHAKDLEPIAR